MTTANLEPEVSPQPVPVAVEQPPVAPVEAAPPPAEDDVPDAVEVRPGERMVPVGAVIALRNELKALKPVAQQAQQLQATVQAMQPYVDFIKANQQVLQHQSPVEPPKPEPQDDPDLVEYARDLELFDPATGKPDVARAARIRERSRADALAVAQQQIAPVQHTTNEQRAASNLQHVLATVKDGDGNPIAEAHMAAAVQHIAQGMPREKVVAMLADPRVMQTLATNALGIQAMQRKSAPPVPGPPLVVEPAGGAGAYVMADSEKRLAQMTGRSEKDWATTASRYQPGRANPLE